MSTLVGNLLDMARIESGAVKLNLQWQPFEEVVGTALHAARGMLQRHRSRCGCRATCRWSTSMRC